MDCDEYKGDEEEDEDEGDEEESEDEGDEEDLEEDDLQVGETRAEREFELRQLLEKSDDQLLTSGLEVPESVQNSVKFK